MANRTVRRTGRRQLLACYCVVVSITDDWISQLYGRLLLNVQKTCILVLHPDDFRETPVPLRFLASYDPSKQSARLVVFGL